MTSTPTLTVRSGPLAKQAARTDLKPAPPARFIAWSVVLVAGYVLLDAASSMVWIDPVAGKPWNPQAGVAVAFIYAGGLRYAAPLLVATWICEALFRHPSTPMLQASAALALTTAFTLAGLAVRWRTLARGLTSVATVRDFLVIAAAGALVTALSYVGVHALATQQPSLAELYDSILHKALGDFAGIIAIMPIVVLLLTPRAETMQVREGLLLDSGVFLLTLAAVIGLVFSVPSQTGERLLYLLFVPLIVLAMRRGFAGAAIGIATAQVVIVTSLWVGGRGVEDATAYQMLMAVLGITALILGAVAAERRLAIAELARRSTELRAQQQALTDAMRNSAASETAATLAHEMSQPLSAIGTYAHAMLEMQRNGKARPAELTAVMERIVAETARTRETMQRIRDFFRSGAARRETVELAAIVADVADALRDRMRAGAILLSTDVPPGLPALSADAVQIGIVLHNLVGNAADAVADVPPPRWIRIAARQHAAFVEVEIADSGPGIDPSVRDVLFEPLATTKPAGMGLGLPISRTLILAHGGRLELASLHPTTFRFTLPIHGNLLQ